MKKAIRVGIAVLMGAVVATAGTHEGITFSSSTVTPTNSVTVTNPVPVTGWVRSFSTVGVSGLATVRVTTVAGKGSSLGAAKTIYGPGGAVVAGVVTNFGDNWIYLADDYLVYRVDNGAITSSVTATSTLIIEN